jgi:hypothetical protein
MKKILVKLIFVAACIALTAYITDGIVRGAAEGKSGFAADTYKMKMEFVKNNAILRKIADSQDRPDLQKYLLDVNNLVQWYFKEAASKLWEKYPDLKDPERIIKEKRQKAEVEGHGQTMAKANLPIRNESYELVRGIYDNFKEGSYKALASKYEGSVRFDVHKIEKDGNKLKWVFMVWGGIGQISYQGWSIKSFKTPTAEEMMEYKKDLAWFKKRGREDELEHPKDLPIAEAKSQSGTPILPLFEGTEYIEDFPPLVQVNYFYTPVCPPNAETLKVAFKLKANTVVSDPQIMRYEFEIPVKGEWKGSWEGVQKIEAAADYQ